MTGWDDPHGPWHDRDHPHEGFLRVWQNLQDFLDMPEEDVAAQYVDNNVISLRVHVPDTSSIDTQPLHLWYQAGNEIAPELGSIVNDHNPCSRFFVGPGMLIWPGNHDLEPRLNAMTTPRLYWIRSALHADPSRLAATSTEHLDEYFGQIAYQYNSTAYTDGSVLRGAIIPMDSEF